MRSLLLAISLVLFGFAPAFAQVATPPSDGGLPEDFYGKVQYFGNHSGEVVATVPGTPRRTDTKCPKREGGCPELIGGSFQAELEFDGDIVKGKYRGTGGMRPSTLIGRRNGANCRLFDTTDGSVWSGRCDREAFIGTVRSVPNAPEQIDLAFETVGVNTVDFYERDRTRELIRAYDQFGGIAFGQGAGEARLDAILQLHGYFVEPGQAYRSGTLRNVERESDKKNSPIYSVYGDYTTINGASAWARARFEYDRFVCIETSVEQGYCRPIESTAPVLDPDEDLFDFAGTTPAQAY
ncbi:MAG: hypothetical protein CL808_01720 [Citromicrobium sp.]|nr:hypothetical protein [Citromicrobium sp.]